MKQRLLVTAIGVFVALVALVAAFLVGVRVGATQTELLQSTVRATMLASELRALRAGNKLDALVNAKELELDSQVLLYARAQKSGGLWLLWPESQSYEHERYLRNVAAYRKEYPAALPKIEVGGTDQTSQEMRNAAALVAQTTEEVIRTYGK
jgi:hypothetical protein